MGIEELGRGVAIVADFGKSVSKVGLWSRDGRLLDRQTRANLSREIDGIRRLDSDGIGEWLVEALACYRGEPVETIVPVGHGAGVVALAGDAAAFAPFDYEQTIPDAIAAEYGRQRDGFTETGSPALPAGLNLGRQLFWQDKLYPAFAGTRLLPWAQYWTWFLSGAARSEATSLGCHSDLWSPGRRTFSRLALRRGWADRFALLARAGDAAGTLRPELAARTGLSPATRIHVGLHDSNAALLAARAFPEIGDGGDATVLSTGTWFVAMRSPAEPVGPATLPENRDCLVNVDVEGRAIPSARFMGGREIELLGERIDLPGIDGVAAALSAGATILPGRVPGCGPFPQSRTDGELRNPSKAAVALYVALMADAALDLIGARDVLLIEGRFAKAEIFTRALAAMRPKMRVYAADDDADVSFGALRLLFPELAPATGLSSVVPLGGDLSAFRREWRTQIEDTVTTRTDVDRMIRAGRERR